MSQAHKHLSQNARKNNILAAKIIADTVKTTLGPKGMDKVLVDQQGNITITNDGATILHEMAVEHPVARMIVEIAQTQETEVGDGTTTAVILAGELLKHAEELLDKKIHPTVISQGYKLASDFCLKALEKYAIEISSDNTVVLEKVAETAMTGKSADATKKQLAQICVQAMTSLAEQKVPQADDVQILVRSGASQTQSKFVDGLVIDKGAVHAQMPQQVSDAKIAVLNCPLEVRQTETQTRIQITDPQQMQAFLNQEEQMIREQVEYLSQLGVNTVFCLKGIDEIAQHYLSQKGIIAFRRLRISDLNTIAKATLATPTNSVKDLHQGMLGSAQVITQREIDEEQYTFISGTPKKVSNTIVLHASTKHVVEELRRAVSDALGDISAVLRAKKVVTGAGSIEMALSKDLKAFAETQSGREQLAIYSFAKALEVIPNTIAENSGLDPIDTLAQLTAAHEKGESHTGINVSGGIIDAKRVGIVEPYLVKTQAIIGASEVTNLILRIDDIIYCGPVSEDELRKIQEQMDK